MTENSLYGIDLVQAGKILRETRKEKGLVIDDIIDSNISAGTISRAERGQRIRDDKFTYLCNKLAIDIDDLPKLIESEISKEDKEKDDIRMRILSIESIIGMSGSEKEVINQIGEWDLNEDHPMYIYIPYLKGQYYLGRKNYEKAKCCFSQSIQISEKYPETRYTNIHAACYSELGRLAYLQNDLDTAIDCTNQGIEVFDQEGLRKQTYYVLLVSKAIYLELLDYRQEASDILNKLWKNIKNIRSIDTILHMYDIKGKILRRSKMYRKATKYCIKGIYLARLNNKPVHAAELWTTLGEIYREQKDLKNAEQCFLTAQSLESKVPAKWILFRLYHQLGLLYMEQGRIIKAQKHFEKALRRGENHSSTLIVRYIQTLKSLADCLVHQKLDKEAMEKYEKALSLADQHSLRYQQKDIQLKIGELLAKTDEGKFLAYVKDLFKKGALRDG